MNFFVIFYVLVGTAILQKEYGFGKFILNKITI